jgi:two-component system response regulator HydG
VDIPLLAERFLEKYCVANGLAADAKHFAKDAMDRLLGYAWPGNIRELESTVTRAALSAREGAIRSGDIQFLHAAEATEDSTSTPLISLREAERRHIRRILQAVSWNKKAAADILEISRGTLYRKIVEFGLQEESGSQPAA